MSSSLTPSLLSHTVILAVLIPVLLRSRYKSDIDDAANDSPPNEDNEVSDEEDGDLRDDSLDSISVEGDESLEIRGGSVNVGVGRRDEEESLMGRR